MPFFYKFLPLLFGIVLSGCNENQFTDVISENWVQEDEVCSDDTTDVTFKTVAYWSAADDTDEYLEDVDLDALTHIIYRSIRVNADGSLNISSDEIDDFEEFLDVVQDDQTLKVGISLGDGNDNNFNIIAEDSGTTNNFVNNVVDFLEDYDLNGVEINWQTIDDDDESDNLEELLDELNEDLYEEGYFLSMTVTSGEDDSQADEVDNDLFDYVDFVNVMAFDLSDEDDLYYTLEDAEDSIEYWTDRCLIQNKLVLGVPFYSGGSAERSFNYIVEDDPDDGVYACKDKSEGRYYNGVETIMDKTNYALLYAGGIMIESLEHDAYESSEYSLLNIISETSNGDYVDICD